MTNAELLAASMSEAALQECVRKLCRMLRVPMYHTHDSRRSEAGWPDIACVVGDELLLRELKTAKGRLTPPQLQWQSWLGQVTRVSVGVWRPSDWLDATIERTLRGMQP